MTETPDSFDEFDGLEPGVQHPGPNPYDNDDTEPECDSPEPEEDSDYV